MSQLEFHHEKFFDTYSKFIETSETGQWLERLNARYMALIHENRELLQGARVLDLASHDGRFSFAALKNGASHVVGIDVKHHLIEKAVEHMRCYGIEETRYDFLVGDMFDCMNLHAPFDVVFCFGILYHINDHMRLFNAIAEIGPKAIIIDTHVSRMDGAVIELRNPLGKSPPPPGSFIEGHPTRGAFEAMFSSFGWTMQYFDWTKLGMSDLDHMSDYESGKRISAVVHCPEHNIPEDIIASAVQEVLDKETDRETLFILITLVAERHQISPQALRTWVANAKRRRSRESGFTL